MIISHDRRVGGPGRIRATVLGIAALLSIAGLAAFGWPAPDPESVHRRVEEELASGRFDRAGAELARLNREPTPPDRMLRARVAMALGRVPQAIDELARVPDDSPVAAEARLRAGQLELRRDRYVAAEAALIRAAELDPRRVQALRELVYIYGMQLRRPELNATYRRLSEVSTLGYQDIFLWCLTRGVSWDPREVTESMARCIAADPSDRWSRLGLAEGLRQRNRFDEAEAALVPLLDSDPDARSLRVRIALDRGDDGAAESLLASGPAGHVGLELLRGRFALARNDGPEALRHYWVAHSREPNLRDSIFGLGQALQMTGDPAAAGLLIEESRKHDRLGSLVQRAAVEANRGDPALIRDLGAACAAIGRIPEARAWYNLAITRDPFDAPAQQALARLKDARGPVDLR